jgi:hypothetical protein
MKPMLAFRGHTRLVEIVGMFEPVVSGGAVTSMRGIGYSITNNSSGSYTIVLDEPIQRLVGFHFEVSDKDAASGVVSSAQMNAFNISTGGTATFTIQVNGVSANTTTAKDIATDATNHYTWISFQIFAEESNGYVR